MSAKMSTAILIQPMSDIKTESIPTVVGDAVGVDNSRPLTSLALPVTTSGASSSSAAPASATTTTSATSTDNTAPASSSLAQSVIHLVDEELGRGRDIPASTEDVFSLETFHDLIQMRWKAGKAFIIAAVQTRYDTGRRVAARSTMFNDDVCCCAVIKCV